MTYLRELETGSHSCFSVSLKYDGLMHEDDDFRARVAVYENPYRFIPQSDDEGEILTRTVSAESRPEAGKSSESRGSTESVEELLEEVLRQYRLYVAKDEWSKVLLFRPEFLRGANVSRQKVERVAVRLKQFQFSLMPGEKVEFNRAPAERIIGELKKLLS